MRKLNEHNRLTALAGDERGASFVLALLLFMVCVFISSIVIASATASTGRLVKASQYDKNQHSVISAARVFRSGGDGRNFSLVEQRTATISNVREESSQSIPTDAWSKVSVISSPEPSDDASFDFLADLTRSALLGEETPGFENPAHAAGNWVDTELTAALPVEYTVTPDLSSLSLDGQDYIVKASGVLKPDWTLELDFYNEAKPGKPALKETEKTHCTIVFAAEVESNVETSSSLGQTSISDGVSNSSVVSQTRTTTVTWKVRSFGSESVAKETS